MHQDLKQKIKILEERLKEAEATIEAIRQGKIDAIVVQGEDKAEIYTLKGIDYTYRILIERMNEGAAILSKEGIVLFANNKLSEILGVEKNKFVGEFLDRFLVNSEKAKLNNLIKRALRDAVSEKIYYVRPADNQLKPLLFSANPMPSDTGGDVGLVVSDLSEVEEKEKLQKIQAKLEEMVIDRTRRLLTAHQKLKIANEQLAREIEQHKLMEAELSKKEQEVTQILNSLAEAVIGLDKSGNCIYANNSSLEVLGYQNQSQVLGKKLPEIFFPGLPPSSSRFKQCQQKIEELLKTGKVFTEGLAYFKKVDGSEFPVSYVLHPIETEQGIQGAVISFISIAERLQLEKQLRTLSSVIEQSIDMVLITNKEGEIIYVNPAFEITTGYS
ncbi:MAG: PAS domain S-box protein [Caldisericaceae bacterium]|nr:PAS domain S-box protein [Caldisericaceae bacterium]